MKMIVVSDTHSHDIPREVLEVFKTSQMIAHAGDFCCLEDYEAFVKLGQIMAVYGNMDDEQLHQILKYKQVFSFGEFSVGLIHGAGGVGPLLDVVKKAFKGNKVDVIIFGHSHHPFNEEIDGVLYFNPGSLGSAITNTYRSYGILEIKGGKVKGKIIQVQG